MRIFHDKRYSRGFFAVCITILLVAVFFTGSAPISVTAEEESLQLYATAAVLMDADSGRVLYGKNAGEPMAMASTTKIMTCILVLEMGDPEEELEISAYAASMPKVHLGMQKGEHYRVRDLLYSLMLESHNDSAVALAEYIGKELLEEELAQKETAAYTVEESKQAVAAFTGRMNQKARELGCEKTCFLTPNGLDATETITLNNGEVIQRQHETTAEELARMLAYCIKESAQRELFLEITRTQSHSFTANGRSFDCSNHNAFLSMMDGALSGKTGFTNKAGYCYVGALEREGKTFVVALLACGWPNHRTYKWSDTRTLMEYGLESYSYRSFLEEDVRYPSEALQPIPVLGGRTQLLGGTACVEVEVEADTETGEEQDGKQLEGLLMREEETVQVECQVQDVLQAPVRTGTRVGEIRYIVDGTTYRTEYVITAQDIENIDFFWCFCQIWRRFFI